METPLELVYTYRRLLGRCEAGAGLELDDIETVVNIEARLRDGVHGAHSVHVVHGAHGDRQRIGLRVTLRNDRLDDEVTLARLDLEGCECRQSPYADEGDVVELVIDDAERGLSYRFKACVTWLRDDIDDDFALGLRFIGTPLLVRRAPRASAAIAHRVAA